jgi:hypothetical protein
MKQWTAQESAEQCMNMRAHLADGLEFHIGAGLGITVRMVLQDERSVGSLHLLRRCSASHTKDLVRIARYHRRHASAPKCSPTAVYQRSLHWTAACQRSLHWTEQHVGRPHRIEPGRALAALFRPPPSARLMRCVWCHQCRRKSSGIFYLAASAPAARPHPPWRVPSPSLPSPEPAARLFPPCGIHQCDSNMTCGTPQHPTL